MADRLVIEIDGNATGLTRELGKAESRLNTFNTKVSASNKALTGFTSKIGTSTNAITKLTTSTKTLDTSIKGINRSFNSLSTSLTRLNTSSKTAATALNQAGRSASSAATHLGKLATSGQAVNTLMTSMGRRMNALNATVSALNTALRGVTRNIQNNGLATTTTTNIVNRYTSSVGRAGGASTAAAGGVNRLSRAQVSLAESFRRSVAQITALRTLTYQALFWFAPLVYSIVKVNAAYETQMQLLKNIAKATTEAGKASEAASTYDWLMTKATTNPFSLDSITDAFVKLRVGGLEPTQGSLQILMDSVAAFGGSTANLQRASVAIQQMAGKGVVSMEELRQQIGEHIPDAMNAMAVGLGVSMGELSKLVESGTLEATSSLNAMMYVLEDRHRGSAEAMMDTWNGLVARLQTAWTKAWVSIAQNERADGFMNTLKEKTEAFINFLNTPHGMQFLTDVSNALAAVLRGFTTAIQFVWHYRDEIIQVAKIFAIMWGGQMVIGTISNLMFALGRLGVITGVLMGSFVKLHSVMVLVGTTLAMVRSRVDLVSAAKLMWGTVTGAAAVKMTALTGATVAANASIWSIGATIAVVTGGVWLLVMALGAAISKLMDFNYLQGVSNQLKSTSQQLDDAKNGGVWKDQEERDSMLGRKRANDQILEQGYYYKDGNGKVYARSQDAKQNGRMGTLYKVPIDAKGTKLNREYWTNRGSNIDTTLTSKDRNTRNFNEARQTSAQIQKEQAVAANMNSTLPGGDINDPNSRLGAIEGKYAARLAQARADGDMELEAKLLREKEAERQPYMNTRRKILADRAENGSPEEKKAAIAALNEMEGSAARYEAFTSGPQNIQGEGDGKPKPKPKPKRDPADPLAGEKSAATNAIVRFKEMENEYSNLKNGEDSVFDADAAEDFAARELALAGNEEALKALKKEYESYLRELKKTMAVEKAIIDIRNQTTETMEKVNAGYEELRIGYKTIESQSDAFRRALEREKAAELATVQARILAGTNNEDYIRQYRQLTREITDATRAKEAELMLNLAADAHAKNEEYRRSKQSSRANTLEDIDLEMAILNNARERYQTDIERRKAERDKIAKDIEASRALEQHLRNQGQDVGADALNAEITVMAAELARQDDINLSMENGNRIWERRLEILRQERLIAEKGPMARWAAENSKTADQFKESVQGFMTGFIDQFVDDLSRGKVAFGDFVANMIKGLIAIILRALIAKAILTALGLPGGFGATKGAVSTLTPDASAAMDANAGIFHTGGIVGTSAPSRSVSAGLFNFAQRYHTGGIAGLGPNEVPIIAEKGEGVFTKEQMKALGTGKGGGNNVEVNVINQTGTEAEVQREQPKFDGEKWVENIILKKMSRPGPIRDTMAAMNRR